MDILKRKLLKIGTECFFYVNSVEDPYVYLRFKGIIRELYNVKAEQVIYRIECVDIKETPDMIHKYMNRNSYRGYDLKREINQTKLLYAFNSKTKHDFIKKELKEKFLFEVSSAMVFELEREMKDEFKKSNTYIIELLKETITKVLER